MVALQEPQQTYFLDELFMALLGHQGDVFVGEEPATHIPGTVPKPSDCYYKTGNQILFISESDRIILDGLLKLGFHFHALQAFVDLEELAWAKQGCSHHRCALSHGISELLDVYSAAVLKLQTRMVEDENPSLATIRYYLSEFLVLLPEVHAMAYQVQISGLRGAQILRLLHEKAVTGATEVHSCVRRLSQHCYQIFYKHLAGWIEHGVLLDKSCEFFIQEPGRDSKLQEKTSAGSAPAREWHTGFQVADDLIPPEVSEQTAANILFIGKAVRALKPTPGQSGDTAFDATGIVAQLQTTETFNSSLFEHSIETLKEKAAEQLWALVKTDGDLMSHLRALRDYFLMGRGDFWQDFLLESHALMSLPAVQATAQTNILVPFQQSASMTSAETDPLFPLISLIYPSPGDQDPSGKTTAGGTVPASQRGMLTETPYATATTDVNRTVRNAPDTTSTQFYSARQSLDSAKTVGQSAEALLTAPTKRTDVPSAAAPTAMGGKAAAGKRGMKVPDYDPPWDVLTLEYKVQWPLHLLLSPEVMMRYGRMFQYLFRLERMQLDLKRCWSSLSEQTRKRSLKKQGVSGNVSNAAVPSGMPSLWQVRTHMAHLISNLQLYIQVDVIQVQYEEMAAKLREVTTLKAAEEAHEVFLSNCITQSCLDVPMFASLLSRTLGYCRTFCNLNQAVQVRKQNQEYPKDLVEAFQRNSRLFFRLLSTPAMQSRARAPYLRLLLLRLNYNGFLQQDTEQFNLSQT